MNLQEQERERAAERWLDEAIGQLRDAGPRAGLETRVLAGLRAHVEQRRRRWTLLVAASAAALLVAAWVASRPRIKPETKPNVVEKALPEPNSVARASRVATVNRPPQKSRRPVREPSEVAAAVRQSPTLRPAIETRQTTFPAAAPLTDQGRLLQAYLRQTPQHELVLIAARQRSAEAIEDLSIPPIEIQDLTPKTEKDQN